MLLRAHMGQADIEQHLGPKFSLFFLFFGAYIPPSPYKSTNGTVLLEQAATGVFKGLIWAQMDPNAHVCGFHIIIHIQISQKLSHNVIFLVFIFVPG